MFPDGTWQICKVYYFFCNSPAFYYLANYIARGRGERFLLALASKERLVSILEKMLDESEFFSEHGIRSYVYPIGTVNSC